MDGQLETGRQVGMQADGDTNRQRDRQTVRQADMQKQAVCLSGMETGR